MFHNVTMFHLPAIYDNVAARVEDKEEVGDEGDQVAPGGETELSLLFKWLFITGTPSKSSKYKHVDLG